MIDDQWRNFFLTCSRYLGTGNSIAEFSNNWCAWTTFSRIQSDTGYWTGGLPNQSDIGYNAIGDSGVWGQPFLYKDLAHIVLPAEFYWERIEAGTFNNGTKQQDIVALSQALQSISIPHRLTKLVLEIKLY